MADHTAIVPASAKSKAETGWGEEATVKPAAPPAADLMYTNPLSSHPVGVNRAAPAAIVPVSATAKAETGSEKEAVKPAAPRAADLAAGARDGKDKALSSAHHPGYCVGNTAYSLFLICMAFLIELVLFLFHCTPIMDVMVDEPNSRAWCGVTPQVAVVAGILLVPAMLEALGFIGQLTCCRHRTLRRMRAKASRTPWRRVSEAKTTRQAFWLSFRYLRKPTSAHYVQLIFALEAKEFLFQALALEQMSRAGIGPGALTLFTTIILLNGGLSPLGMRWIVNRINGIDDPVRRRALASRWISRLLLFDATCDLLYSFFGLAHLVFRYLTIFGGISGSYAEMEIVNRYSRNGPDHTEINDLKALMLIGEASNALFSGANAADITVKFLSRVLPLLQAPFRVVSAFGIRQSVSAGNEHDTAAAAAAAAVEEEEEEEAATGAIPALRRRAAMLVKSSSLKGTYRPVPCWAAGLLSVAVITFCSTVYVVLWTWGDCKIPEVRQNCAVRVYPIFTIYDDAEDFNCRSCACNTLLYSSTNCVALSAKNRSTTQQSMGCGGHDHGLSDRYASQALNLSRRILEPATTIAIQVCPSDTDLLETLASNADQPTVLLLHAVTEDAAPIPSSIRVEPPVVWTFPKHFGQRLNRRDVWPMAVWDMKLLVDSSLKSIRLANLPSAQLARMTTLVNLHLDSAGLHAQDLPDFGQLGHNFMSLGILNNLLTLVPPSIGQLTNLQELRLAHNLITEVPAFIGQQLTSLTNLGMMNNLISEIPSSIGGRLTALWRLSVQNNRITAIPSAIGAIKTLNVLEIGGQNLIRPLPISLGELTSLERLRLAHSAISSAPSSLGRLTGLKRLWIQGNLFASVPSFIQQLTGLTILSLARNPLKEIPSFVGRLAGLQTLYLNNCSLSAIPLALGHLTGLRVALELSDNSLISVPSFIGRLTNLESLDFHNNKISVVSSSLGRLTKLKELWLQNNALTTAIPSVLTASRSSASPNLRLSLEANNISLAALMPVLAAVSTTPSMSETTEPASSLMLLGRNPACSAANGSSLASRVGPWRIKCEPECALDCLETGIGDGGEIQSWIGNTYCNPQCNTAACGWDKGECIGHRTFWEMRSGSQTNSNWFVD